MRRQSSYSRRQFFRVGAAGVATTMVVASGRRRGVARPAVQRPPPTNAAPRVVRNPPLDAREHLCVSGGSHTSDTGPVLNPHDPKRSAGGSSSGSAALVVARECDMAIGGDQGGSIRIPSSYSGAVGLKPTYGLVPYTGVFPIELTLDHTGPIARTAADCALLLEAIAGADGLDPRPSGAVRTEADTT